MATITYSDNHSVYAFKKNNLTFCLVQGEGLSGTVDANSCYKSLRLKLYDEREPVTLTSMTSLKLYFVRPDGYEGTIDCTVEDSSTGIIQIPVKTNLTAVAGRVRGTVKVNYTNNSLIFHGINFNIDESIDVEIPSA